MRVWLAALLALLLAPSPGVCEEASPVERAQALWRGGEFDAARELLKAYLEREPRDRDARWSLAQLQLFALRVEAAEENLALLARDDPDDVRTVARWSQALVLLGRREEAAAVYRDYLERHPDRGDVAHALALVQEHIDGAGRLRAQSRRAGWLVAALLAGWLLLVLGLGRWIGATGKETDSRVGLRAARRSRAQFRS